ncbi:hypothetical protein [Helicobacter pylori]|uniref:hypothetical protein n=1 Tax=Helicobacter pylori TaxID=210 RepID=UPI000D339B61|nr:hypothetical protein [Helicobacter pylori]PUD37886.1 hypothetical protein C2R88_02135 [Helicobacter pylori]
MRQEHETATSFNELKAITQAIMLKKDALNNATNQASERTQETNNANAKAHTPERTQEARAQNKRERQYKRSHAKTTLKPKSSAQTKKGALNPTKKAFSERQITAFRDKSQASANKSQETKQANQQGDNANAFKTEPANNSSLRAKPSAKAFKQGLTNTLKQPKGCKNEA